MKTDLLKFYTNEKPNNRNVYLKEMWSYTNDQLENEHKYIQWMFPTDSKSWFNFSAPTLTTEDIDILKNDERVMNNFKKSIQVIFQFYGFKLMQDDSIIYSTDFEIKAKSWITINNHNYRRISRILRFLTLFEFNKIKRELLVILSEIYSKYGNVIGDRTYQIWQCN